MPIYEYKCGQCGADLEVMHKVSDPAPATCERCGAAGSLERQVSRTSFQLKGGGWYSDLYSSKKSDGGSTSSSAASSTTAASSTSGSTAPASASPAAGSSASGSSSSGSGSSSGGGTTP